MVCDGCADSAAGCSVLSSVLWSEVGEVVGAASSCVYSVADVEGLVGGDGFAASDAGDRDARGVCCTGGLPDDAGVPLVGRMPVMMRHAATRLRASR